MLRAIFKVEELEIFKPLLGDHANNEYISRFESDLWAAREALRTVERVFMDSVRASLHIPE